MVCSISVPSDKPPVMRYRALIETVQQPMQLLDTRLSVQKSIHPVPTGWDECRAI